MSPSKPVVQQAVAADVEAIAKIGASTFSITYGHSIPAEHLQAYLEKTYTPAAISNEIASKKNKFFIARLNPSPAIESGEVVGFIQMKLGTTEPCIPPYVPICELHRIYVAPDHLGGGIGQLLVDRGLNWARDQLLDPDMRVKVTVNVINENLKESRAGVWLGVWEGADRAQRFYQRLGFERLGTHDFIIGDMTHKDFVMVKWL